jgi:hypothetical protein
VVDPKKSPSPGRLVRNRGCARLGPVLKKKDRGVEILKAAVIRRL